MVSYRAEPQEKPTLCGIDALTGVSISSILEALPDLIKPLARQRTAALALDATAGELEHDGPVGFETLVLEILEQLEELPAVYSGF